MDRVLLTAHLTYDPVSGIFRWLQPTSLSVKKGDQAGYVSVAGYRQIRLYGKPYYSHRLAWLYMTGYWPDDEIDHINGRPGDDRWCNLREATRQENALNQGIRSNNNSGVKGVFLTRYGTYQASVWIARKRVYCRNFKTLEKAAAAYQDAALRIHGKFARISESPSRRMS